MPSSKAASQAMERGVLSRTEGECVGGMLLDLLPDNRSIPSIRSLASLGTGGTRPDSVAWPATSEGACLGALRLAALAQDTIRLGTGPAMSEPRGMTRAGREASRMVRKGGFEPSHSCECQPLKLVK
jgi:hypothetical protein